MTTDPSFYSGMLEAIRTQLLHEARTAPEEVFGRFELRPGLRILDAGCGTGDYLRVMAPLVAPGEAVGVDLSNRLINHARQRLGETDVNVSFRVGDAHQLPFADASFDRVVSTQLLLHLADPWRAVQEMRRVLAAAGKLSIGEWDWDSMCLAVSDQELGRRFTHLLCDQMRHGLIVRELGWRLPQLGFANVDVRPQVRLARDLDAAFRWLIEPATRELLRMGALTDADGARLLADLHERAATGRYFLARIYYTIIATTD